MATQTPELSGSPSAHHTVAALLQPWIDFVPQQQRRLGLFICLAIAVHVAAFFFIRIDATRAELQHPARIHVTIENPHPAASTDETGMFLDGLSDPRLFLLPTVPLKRVAAASAAPGLGEINLQLGSQPLPPPAAYQDVSLVPNAAPSLQNEVIADMQPARQAFNYDQTAPRVATKTAWQWDPGLGSRRPITNPALPSPVSGTDINPTELRIAIDSDGGVSHVLLEETCQKPELDQLAILAARKLRFPAVDQPATVWAHVTIFWRVIAPPVEVVEPTPPTPPGP